ncbi:MAG TPA: tetratricopeptide repeat protein [Geobacteraceae bacterium]|nr:tetratricopeptide repeat protein [Geobacteraceae bacterium]
MNKLTAGLTIAAICCLTGFRNPPGAARFMELGAKAQSEGHPAEALEMYTKGINLAPDKPGYYMTRAFLLLKLGRREEALRDFDSYVELEPTSAQGYISRGMLLSDLGREKEADANFRQACVLGDPGGCSFAGEGKR